MLAYKSVVSHVSISSIISSVVGISASVLTSEASSKSHIAKAAKPINNAVNSVAKRLKYLSINALIGAPKRHISHAIKKKRKPRDTIDAMMNIAKLISNNPPAMVNSLYGSGVKPAVKTIQKLYLSNSVPTLLKPSTLNTWLKKKVAIAVGSPAGVVHRKWPMQYPTAAPMIEPARHIAAKRNDLLIAPRHKAIRRMSGGIGNQLDSQNARIKSANQPQRLSLHDSTQLYNLLIISRVCSNLGKCTKITRNYQLFHHL